MVLERVAPQFVEALISGFDPASDYVVTRVWQEYDQFLDQYPMLMIVFTFVVGVPVSGSRILL